jgi:hypothetical protein
VNTHALTVGGYLVILAIGFVLWFITRKNDGKHLTDLSSLLKHLLQFRGTRLGMIMFWWWLGWHFLVSVINRH